MPFLTQFRIFFVSSFGDAAVSDELNAFLRSHRIVNVEKCAVDSERGIGWNFLVEYAGDGKSALSSDSGSSSPRVDYREILGEREFALFDRLRELRKQIAEDRGVKVYMVFSNDQLAQMVKKNVKNLKDIMSINGVGEARAKQYGDPFLKALAVTNVPGAEFPARFSEDAETVSEKPEPTDEAGKLPF